MIKYAKWQTQTLGATSSTTQGSPAGPHTSAQAAPLTAPLTAEHLLEPCISHLRSFSPVVVTEHRKGGVQRRTSSPSASAVTPAAAPAKSAWPRRSRAAAANASRRPNLTN